MTPRNNPKPKSKWAKDFMKSYIASRAGTAAAERYGFSQSPSLKPYTAAERTGTATGGSTDGTR